MADLLKAKAVSAGLSGWDYAFPAGIKIADLIDDCISAGICIAINAKMAAGIIHADVFAEYAAAFLTLAFIFHRNWLKGLSGCNAR